MVESRLCSSSRWKRLGRTAAAVALVSGVLLLVPSAFGAAGKVRVVLRPEGSEYQVTVSGTYDRYPSEIAALVQYGGDACLASSAAETGRVEEQLRSLGPASASDVISAELGTGSRTSGSFSQEFYWGGTVPPGSYRVCAYLLPPRQGGEPADPPEAVASAPMRFARAKSGGSSAGAGSTSRGQSSNATSTLRPGELALFSGSELKCLAFAPLASLHGKSGVACYFGASTYSVEPAKLGAYLTPGGVVDSAAGRSILKTVLSHVSVNGVRHVALDSGVVLANGKIRCEYQVGNPGASFEHGRRLVFCLLVDRNGNPLPKGDGFELDQHLFALVRVSRTRHMTIGMTMQQP